MLKDGFETSFTSRYILYACVQALDKNGLVLGTSLVHETVLPIVWIQTPGDESVEDLLGALVALVAWALDCSTLPYLYANLCRRSNSQYEYHLFRRQAEA